MSDNREIWRLLKASGMRWHRCADSASARVWSLRHGKHCLAVIREYRNWYHAQPFTSIGFWQCWTLRLAKQTAEAEVYRDLHNRYQLNREAA